MCRFQSMFIFTSVRHTKVILEHINVSTNLRNSRVACLVVVVVVVVGLTVLSIFWCVGVGVLLESLVFLGGWGWERGCTRSWDGAPRELTENMDRSYRTLPQLSRNVHT